MARSKVLGCVAAMWLTAVTAAGAEETVSVGVAADVLSKYIWRGQNVVDDWVLEPSASIGYRGFTGSVWGNQDLTGDAVGSGQFNELDFTLDYSNAIPGLEVLNYSLGAIHYDFVNTPFAATTEVYAGLGLDVPLAPALHWYYDADEIQGSYIQVSIGHTIEKLHQWRDDCSCGLALGASLGYGTESYNRGYFGVEEGGLNDLTLTAGLPFSLGKLTLKPTLSYSMMIDDDIRDATDKSDNFWGGISAAYDF
jgi:hypothetical protein